MQQRRQLQTPGGKVNNGLCQPRSIRGKGANFFVECRGLFVVETFGVAVVANKCELSKLSFNNTLCKYLANGVNLQTNTKRATLRQLSKQQGVLPLGKLLDGVGKVAKSAKGSMLQRANISIRAKFGCFGLQKILKNF